MGLQEQDRGREESQAMREEIAWQVFESNSREREDVSPLCRVCGKESESVDHLVSVCESLAKREYRRRHDRMGLRVYWEVCRKYGIQCAERWYEEKPDEVRVSKDQNYEVWWDRAVQTANTMESNRPDVVLIDRVQKEWIIIDFSVPWDKNVRIKEDEKVRKYSPLAREVRRMHKVFTKVVPIVVGSLRHS